MPVEKFYEECYRVDYKYTPRGGYLVIPPQEVCLLITRESDYPYYVFGAPKYYVAYLKVNGRDRAIAYGETITDLITDLLRWKDNPYFWSTYGNIIEDAIVYLSRYE